MKQQMVPSTPGIYQDVDDHGNPVTIVVTPSYVAILGQEFAVMKGSVNLMIDGDVNQLVTGNIKHKVLGNYEVDVDEDFRINAKRIFLN